MNYFDHDGMYCGPDGPDGEASIERWLVEVDEDELVICGVSLHLMHIERIDGARMGWSELQWVKEHYFPNHDAFQLFPPAEGVVDLVNQYHLYVVAAEGLRLPFCFEEHVK